MCVKTVSQSKTRKMKAVLLRERKRHTAHRVGRSSLCCSVAWRVPHPILVRCTPSCLGWRVSHPVLARRYPREHFCLGLGYHPTWDWVPSWPRTVVPPGKGPGTRGLGKNLGLGYPCKGHVASGSIMGWRWGTPLGKDMEPVEVLWDGDGVPPVNRQTPVKTVPSPCFGCGR